LRNKSLVQKNIKKKQSEITEVENILRKLTTSAGRSTIKELMKSIVKNEKNTNEVEKMLQNFEIKASLNKQNMTKQKSEFQIVKTVINTKLMQLKQEYINLIKKETNNTPTQTERSYSYMNRPTAMINGTAIAFGEGNGNEQSYPEEEGFPNNQSGLLNSFKPTGSILKPIKESEESTPIIVKNNLKTQIIKRIDKINSQIAQIALSKKISQELKPEKLQKLTDEKAELITRLKKIKENTNSSSSSNNRQSTSNVSSSAQSTSTSKVSSSAQSTSKVSSNGLNLSIINKKLNYKDDIIELCNQFKKLYSSINKKNNNFFDKLAIRRSIFNDKKLYIPFLQGIGSELMKILMSSNQKIESKSNELINKNKSLSIIISNMDKKRIEYTKEEQEIKTLSDSLKIKEKQQPLFYNKLLSTRIGARKPILEKLQKELVKIKSSLLGIKTEIDVVETEIKKLKQYKEQLTKNIENFKEKSKLFIKEKNNSSSSNSTMLNKEQPPKANELKTANEELEKAKIITTPEYMVFAADFRITNPEIYELLSQNKLQNYIYREYIKSQKLNN